MGLNHFLRTDTMAGYAEAKGLPAPRLGVLSSGGLLAFGGLGIAAGAFVTLAAGALATFTVRVRGRLPRLPGGARGPAARRDDRLPQNTVIAGGATALLGLDSVPWPYALDLSLL